MRRGCVEALPRLRRDCPLHQCTCLESREAPGTESRRLGAELGASAPPLTSGRSRRRRRGCSPSLLAPGPDSGGPVGATLAFVRRFVRCGRRRGRRRLHGWGRVAARCRQTSSAVGGRYRCASGRSLGSCSSPRLAARLRSSGSVGLGDLLPYSSVRPPRPLLSRDGRGFRRPSDSSLSAVEHLGVLRQRRPAPLEGVLRLVVLFRLGLHIYALRLPHFVRR